LKSGKDLFYLNDLLLSTAYGDISGKPFILIIVKDTKQNDYTDVSNNKEPPRTNSQAP